MKESKFQHEVIKELERKFPHCIVMKSDSSYIQGIPDLLVLYGTKWASLEVKKSAKEAHRPNQDYYVEAMNDMSYSAFIFPENREEIMDELSRYFSGARVI